MAALDNPTKTRGIEKAWRREINKRFNQFTKSVIDEIQAVNRLTVNEFRARPDQLIAYMVFFQQQLDSLIIGDWQEKYQQRSYQLAIDRMNQELKRQGVTLTALESGAALTALELSAVIASFDSFAPRIFNPVHQEALSFLFTRSFESLSSFSQDMARNIRIILFDGAQQGLGIREIARQIRTRIGVAKTRARLIAQTETIQAFQRGTINQTVLASDFLGEDIKLRWLTVRGSNVRHLHAGWHGRVFTREDVFRMINISPWNCRCGLAPVIKEADTEAKRLKFATERKQLVRLIAVGDFR